MDCLFGKQCELGLFASEIHEPLDFIPSDIFDNGLSLMNHGFYLNQERHLLYCNSRALESETDVDFHEIVPSLGTRLNNTTMRVKDIEGPD